LILLTLKTAYWHGPFLHLTQEGQQISSKQNLKKKKEEIEVVHLVSYREVLRLWYCYNCTLLLGYMYTLLHNTEGYTVQPVHRSTALQVYYAFCTPCTLLHNTEGSEIRTDAAVDCLGVLGIQSQVVFLCLIRTTKLKDGEG